MREFCKKSKWYKKPDIKVISLEYDDVIRTSICEADCNPHKGCPIDY